jgi:hypothetical protein
MSTLVEKFVKDAFVSDEIKNLEEVENAVFELLPSFNAVRSNMVGLVYYIYGNRRDYFLTPETDRYIDHFNEYLIVRFGFAQSTAYTYTKIAKTLETLGKNAAKRLLEDSKPGLITYLLNVSQVKNIKKHKHTILTMDSLKIDRLLEDQAKPAKRLFKLKKAIDGLEIKVNRGKPEFTVTIDYTADESGDIDEAFEQRDMLLKRLDDFEANIVEIKDESVENVEERVGLLENETTKLSDKESSPVNLKVIR